MVYTTLKETWDLDFEINCKVYFNLKRALWLTSAAVEYFSLLSRWKGF